MNDSAFCIRQFHCPGDYQPRKLGVNIPSTDHQSCFVICCQQPTIISPCPQDKSVASGNETVFRVKATGEHLHFQWQKDHNNLCEGGKYWDINTDTLHIVKVEKCDEGHYRCHVTTDTDKKGKFSNEAKLTVGKLVIARCGCYVSGCW